MTCKRQHERRRHLLGAVAIALSFAGAVTPARAANLAFIDEGMGSQTPGNRWCAFFEEHGHTCTVMPVTGPDSPLDAFDVVIDMSPEWSDPDGLLADVLRSGKGVITRNRAPRALAEL